MLCKNKSHGVHDEIDNSNIIKCNRVKYLASNDPQSCLKPNNLVFLKANGNEVWNIKSRQRQFDGGTFSKV